MSPPVCSVIEAAEVAQVGSLIMQLWLVTVVGFLLLQFDYFNWEWRIRSWLRRRRLRRIRAARLAEV